jgi:hypothetical protein
MSAEANGTESPQLRRELHLWEAVGISPEEGLTTGGGSGTQR